MQKDFKYKENVEEIMNDDNRLAYKEEIEIRLACIIT